LALSQFFIISCVSDPR